MNKNVKPSVKTGTGSRSTNPGGVGQLGQSQGSHVTRGEESDYRGDPLHSGRSFQPVKFGNEVALNVRGGGPGTGRTIHKTGSQQQYGSGGPEKPSGRDILGSFGPESSRPHNPGNRSRSDTDADF
jgi:hypothetical protein